MDDEAYVAGSIEEYLTSSLNALVKDTRGGVMAEGSLALWEELVGCHERGGAVLAFGNGGSAADAQHLVAELVGRFEKERVPIRAAALTADSSVLTALGNDYGFDHVFERQVKALVKEGDLAVGITTSGRSINVGLALAAAKEAGARTLALTGDKSGWLAEVQGADRLVAVGGQRTAHVQEAHRLVIHAACRAVDVWLG